MKKYLIIIFTIALTIFSCSDLLDVEPQQSIDSTVALNTAADVESAVIGMYSILGRGSLYGTNFSLLSELLGAETHIQWQGTFQSYRQVGNKNMLKENSEAARTWINAYDGINLANNILSALTVVEDADLRNTFEGEALLIRAILHFELVRLYAKPWNDGNPSINLGVPLKTTPTLNEEEASELVGRNTVSEVYAQVITDLENAEFLLPEENGIRVNTFIASAFLAKVFLQQGNYADARDKANLVIANGPYALNATVTSSFLNDNTSESIFEIQQNEQNNPGRDNDGLATFYASLVGIGRGDVEVESFYSDGISDTAYVFTDRITTYDMYDSADTRFTDLFYFGLEGSNRPGRLCSRKWNSPGQNIPIIRLAEMLLIRAECNLREATTLGADPLTDINAIRSRAELPALGSVTLADVLKEKRLELAFEGARVHDIKRLQQDLVDYTFVDSLDTYVPFDTVLWNHNSMVFPIPQREVDANSILAAQQNPGY
jgi:hypothetical protein